MSKKILSVIVPSYNMEGYLPKCLGSLVVAPRLMDRMEVLVVNDGSQDRTSEIAHEFANKWPQTFIVIDKANGNYGSCVNAALPCANGEYVKILDADDSFETNDFCRFIRFLDGVAQGTDVVFSDYVTVDSSNVKMNRVRFQFPPDRNFGIDEIIKCAENVAMHAIAYRTDILRAIGYHQSEGISFTDTEWCFAPMSAVRSAVYFPHVVYRYLVGREGQTVSRASTIRNFHMYFTLLGNMVKFYVDKRDDERFNRRFMGLSLIRLVRLMCDAAVRFLPLKLSYKALVQLLNMVEKHEEFAQIIPQIYVSRMFRFYYMRFLEAHSLLAWPYLAVLKCYFVLIEFVGRVR